MKKTADYLLIVLTILPIAAVVFTLVAICFGWRLDAVLSGSMEPELKVGSIVVTRPVQAEEISTGDVVTFRSPMSDLPIVHRVVAAENGLFFQTKGDANEIADPLAVPAQDIVGKVCFHVPYLGYVANFVKTPFGIVLACLLGLLVMADAIRNRLRTLVRAKAGTKIAHVAAGRIPGAQSRGLPLQSCPKGVQRGFAPLRFILSPKTGGQGFENGVSRQPAVGSAATTKRGPPRTDWDYRSPSSRGQSPRE